MTLFDWLKSAGAADDPNLGMLQSAVQRRLPQLAAEEVKKITGFAGLLGKVAYADMDISLEEAEKIRRTLVDILKLEGALAESLIEVMTVHRVQLFSVEDHLYARLVNEVCSKHQKQLLLETLFALAAADDVISSPEDAAVWTAARSLGFSHAEFIAVRKQFQEQLEILKS